MNITMRLAYSVAGLIAITISSAYADHQPQFESTIQASYYAMKSNGHENHLVLSLENVNTQTDESGCNGTIPMPVSAPRLRVNASKSRQLQFTHFHADGKGFCIEPGESTMSYLIPGVTDEQPLQIPTPVKSNQSLSYAFITFNDGFEHLTNAAYEKLDSKAQSLCQQAIRNARPKAVSGSCYAIPLYNNSNRNAGYYAAMVQMGA